jgi:drug/metabolite transporter (DMT)-like permease
MISTLEPVVTVALAVMVLGETMTLHKILGGMMIIAAVLLLARCETNPKIS